MYEHLTPWRTEASKYVDTLSAQRAINRARQIFVGAVFSKIERGSRYFILVKHEDYVGYLRNV